MRRLALLAVPALAAFAALPAAAADQKVVFQFQDNRITESSGLAASAKHPDIVYTHNDSDAGPVLYAVDTDGDTVASLTLQGAPARDWEAITRCSDDGTDVLWVGDIGDNINAWKTYRLLRVPEPAALKTGKVPWAQYDMRYADGKARDAEALLCHPKTGRLYIVSKEDAGTAGVYRGPAAMKRGSVNVFTRIADAPASVTDGAFVSGGNFAVLRGYFEAQMVAPPAGWKSVARFTPPIQIQGESVAETADGKALLFGSEGVGSSVWRVPIPEDLQKLPTVPGAGEDAGVPSAQEKAKVAKDAKDKGKAGKDEGGKVVKEVQESAKNVSNDGIPGLDGPLIALLSVLGLGLLVLVMATRRD